MLTEREKECVELAALGLSAKEIGQRLSISHKTVEAHLRAARGTLNAKNTVNLVYLASKSGLISILFIVCSVCSIFSGDDMLRPNRVRVRIVKTARSSGVKKEWAIYS